ncbi:MAG: NH(3)-dependent NAD(+) synthetase [Candidatus Peregrinibacteria bacterium GW2011_GWA2_44_7]|nr:MAG: NH(3)-dependent NAD(+) synthetase [Candidatus Peregrinibacteria bacterium GW2011_GWA2_44_7]
MSKKSVKNLWDNLKIKPGSTRQVVDTAYKKLPAVARNDADIRLAWQILRDPYYSRLYQYRGSIPHLYDAGFFDDRRDSSYDNQKRENPHWLVTPTQKISRRIQDLHTDKKSTEYDKKPFIVLLTTGGFSPLHRGHIEMMELAKEDLEKRGFLVVGGYVSPSHDVYISKKYAHRDYPHSADRITACRKMLSLNDWLMVDPWESVHNSIEIRFTEVIERLKKYLRRHIVLPNGRSLQVFYVFGSDNASFAYAFLGKGHAICIQRPGHIKTFKKIANDPIFRNKKNIIFSSFGTAKPGITSSSIRQSTIGDKLSAISDLSAPPQKVHYFIRDEEDWAIHPWMSFCDKKILFDSKEHFLSQLTLLFRSTFQCTKIPSQTKILSVHLLHLSQQIQSLKKLRSKIPLLNMDVCIRDHFNLDIGRAFAVSDFQNQMENH